MQHLLQGWTKGSASCSRRKAPQTGPEQLAWAAGLAPFQLNLHHHRGLTLLVPINPGRQLQTSWCREADQQRRRCSEAGAHESSATPDPSRAKVPQSSWIVSSRWPTTSGRLARPAGPFMICYSLFKFRNQRTPHG